MSLSSKGASAASPPKPLSLKEEVVHLVAIIRLYYGKDIFFLGQPELVIHGNYVFGRGMKKNLA